MVSIFLSETIVVSFVNSGWWSSLLFMLHGCLKNKSVLGQMFSSWKRTHCFSWFVFMNLFYFMVCFHGFLWFCFSWFVFHGLFLMVGCWIFWWFVFNGWVCWLVGCLIVVGCWILFSCWFHSQRKQYCAKNNK